MYFLDVRLALVVVGFFLIGKSVQPVGLWFLVVGKHVVVFLSEVFLAEFERSLKLDLLHAAVFRLARDVAGGDVDAVKSLVAGDINVNLTLGLPLVSHIDNGLRLSRKRSGSFELG